jgi:hypothetical protein
MVKSMLKTTMAHRSALEQTMWQTTKTAPVDTILFSEVAHITSFANPNVKVRLLQLQSKVEPRLDCQVRKPF